MLKKHDLCVAIEPKILPVPTHVEKVETLWQRLKRKKQSTANYRQIIQPGAHSSVHKQTNQHKMVVSRSLLYLLTSGHARTNLL